MGVRIDELYWELDIRSQKMHEAIDRGEKRLLKFAAFIKAHPIAVLGALGAAFIATGVAAAKFAEQVDSHLRRVDALLPRTTVGVDRMRQRLIELSKTTPVALEQLAAGLEHVVELGERDPARAFQKLTAATKLQQIANVDLTTSIGMLDQVMDAFHLGADQAADVVDILTVSAQRGTNIGELAPVLNMVGTQARAAGLNLSEVVAVLNTLGERGVPTRQAIAVVREALDKLRGAQVGADLISQSLGVHLEVVGGHLKLAGQGAEEFNGALLEMEQRSGRASQMLGRINSSATAQAEIVKNQLKTAWLQFGESAAPLLLTLTKAATGFLEFMTGQTGVDIMVGNLRELAGGWRDVDMQLTDAAKDARLAHLGADRFLAALDAMSGPWKDNWDTFSKTFRRAVRQMTQEDLRALHSALTSMTDAEREQMGVTTAQLGQMRDLAKAQLDVVARAAAAARAPAPTGPAGPLPLDADAIRRRAELRETMVRQLASLTTGVADDLTAQLGEFERRVAETFGTKVPADITRMLAQLRTAITGSQSFEEMDRQLASIEQHVSQITEAFGEVPATLGLEILPGLDDLIGRLSSARDAQARGTTLWKQYNDELTRAHELVKKLAAKIGQAGDEQTRMNQALDQTLDKLELQASRIQGAARGALQLATAFGIVDEQASAALQNIVQIATEIPKVLAVLRAGGSLTKALPGLLSIAGGVAGLVSGLMGGGDAEAQRRREVLEENTNAIRTLTQRIGEAFLEVTGAEFTKVRDATERALAVGAAALQQHGRGVNPQVATQNALREFATAGISMAELRDLAQQLGIAFAGALPTMRELQQLAEAMAQTELTRFAQTFTGQIELLAREFELFDITDPLDQLQRLREIAQGFAASPLIDALFGGLDLTTAEGRASLEARIRDLYTQLQSGAITPAQLGGLTPQQLLELLSQLETTMDKLSGGAGAGQGQTAQFEINRQVTEVTGMRLASLLTTSLIWQQEIAENTAQIVALLGGTAGGALRPPTFAELAAAVPGPLVDSLTIQVTVQGPMGPDVAQDLGDRIGRKAAAAFDATLGGIYRRRALLSGTITRN